MNNVNKFLKATKNNNPVEVTEELLTKWEAAEKLDEMLEDAKVLHKFEKANKGSWANRKDERGNITEKYKKIINTTVDMKTQFLEKYGSQMLTIYNLSSTWAVIKRDLTNGYTKTVKYATKSKGCYGIEA